MYALVLRMEEFSEKRVWAGVEGEWRPLFGSLVSEGVSVEWHDFECAKTLDWSRSFHPESFEICVNFEGCGTIHEHPATTTIVNPQQVAYYAADKTRLRADRHAGQRHRFLTVEMSRTWLHEAVRGHETVLNREAQGFLDGKARLRTAGERPLNPRVRRSAEEMLHAPIQGLGAGFWFRAKILEISALILVEPAEELFYQRHKRLASERVERVKQALARDLQNPPSLSELGREVGCSPFYLSRIFSEHTGLTISRYLRNLRLERAAELLRSGRSNVTEAALAVGYSSLSHFSKAFAEMFGVCPCVFPLNGRLVR
jgi:AraC family transcriptional regulator